MPTLAELLTPRTQAQIKTRLEELLFDKQQQYGVFVTDWASGGVGRTLIETFAEGMADLEVLRVDITKGGYLDLAEGDWLDLKAQSDYDTSRFLSTFTLLPARLTAEAGFGPYTINPGQLWASSANGKRFNNTTGGILPAGGQLTLDWKAESPGSSYNLSPGQLTILNTPLPGVSITNLVGPSSAGRDEESDAALRERCRKRWAILSLGRVKYTYEVFALEANPAVTKVKVLDQNPRGQGTCDVVIYGDGALGGTVVSEVNAYIQERRPNNADVLVYQATALTVNLVGTVECAQGFTAQAQASSLERLAALQRTLPIGGIIDGSQGKLFRSAIVEALFGDYAVNVAINNPAADTNLTAVQVVVFNTAGLTWVEV